MIRIMVLVVFLAALGEWTQWKLKVIVENATILEKLGVFLKGKNIPYLNSQEVR
jgi:hypothetical protein